MPSDGRVGTGLDRALRLALDAGLHQVLDSGEIDARASRNRPEPYVFNPIARPWQRPISEPQLPPGLEEPRWIGIGIGRRRPTVPLAQQPATGVGAPEYDLPRVEDVAATDRGPAGSTNEGGSATGRDRDAARAQLVPDWFHFRDDLTGVVMVHGVGSQRPGQSLLDWTRPIIRLIDDACAANPALSMIDTDVADGVTDPIIRSNIDFSGDSFPVVQIRVPRRTDVPFEHPWASEHRWIVTEAWTASEVDPPSVGTMVAWLGEQEIGRVFRTISQNTQGGGPLGALAALIPSLIGAMLTFVLLVVLGLVWVVRLIPSLALFGLTRLVPTGLDKVPVRTALAGGFTSFWFGGARTLLRDRVQSANVRARLVATIRALRAYGCRHVVLVAHSGGTLVCATTLTDPTYPRLRVNKLVTIGQVLNLGWRLENQNPDLEPATPAIGSRLRGDLALRQPGLQWRDFWASHDPAPRGSLRLPLGMTDPGPSRFTAERIYNRMSITEDHGAYWDNDEQFLIPLIREIDVATGDRGGSRFYSDEAEASLRTRRQERVAQLALWRRIVVALPVMAILAAAVVTAGGLARDLGDVVLAVFGLVPGNEEVGRAAQALADEGNKPVVDVLPAWTWEGWYELGLTAIGMGFVLMVITAVLPGRADGLWARRPAGRSILLTIDIAIGAAALIAILVASRSRAGAPTAEEQVAFALLSRSVVLLLAILCISVILIGIGTLTRRRIGELHGRAAIRDRFLRGVLVTTTPVFLGALLILLIVVLIGVVLVLVGNAAVAESASTRRFILGAIVVFLGFQLLGRLGSWRWSMWDMRERRVLRRRPLVYPFRYGAYVLGTMLTLAAALAALGIALGAPALLSSAGLLLLLVVVLGVGIELADRPAAD